MGKQAMFLLEPYYKTVLWGGDRIAAFKGEPSKGDNIGESWELSDIDGCESVVASGDFSGHKLSEVLGISGEEILGQKVTRLHGNKMPLLVKFIDAKEDLSIQVHPDDYMAGRRHNCSGKTELWYSIAPTPGAAIISGLSMTVTPEELAERINNNDIISILSKYYSRRGDLYYLPSGRIHSICAGNFLLEIQQSSDITYRIYDYNRVGLDGRKRDLHIEEAKEAVDYRVHEDYLRHFEPIINREIVLKECPYFAVSIVCATQRYRIPVARFGSFRVIVATRGSGYIIDDEGRVLKIEQGHSVLVPASTEYVEIAPASNEVEVVTAYVI